jgi:hypothetical protein
MKKATYRQVSTMVKMSLVNKHVNLTLQIPSRWLLFLIATFLLWRVPELWKAIESVKSFLVP